jgi:hypothetical protein
VLDSEEALMRAVALGILSDAARKKVGTVVDDAAAVAADQTHRLRNSLVRHRLGQTLGVED